MTDLEGLLGALRTADVDFILVGGMAGIAHGAARLTYDVDIVYERSTQNIQRVVNALELLNPYLRGAPLGLAFRWDPETIAHGLNFTLTTTLGDIDILGEISGGGAYHDLISHTTMIDVEGTPCRCLNLDKLIQVKRAAARKKDLEAIAELEALLEERDRRDEPT